MLPSSAAVRVAAARALLAAPARHAAHAPSRPPLLRPPTSLQASFATAFTSRRLAYAPLFPPAWVKATPRPLSALTRGFAAGAARGAPVRAALDGGGWVRGGVGRTGAAAVGRSARRPASTAAMAATAAPPTLPLTSSAIAANLPPHARRALAWWVGGCAGWVASMVALGGATRLTRSGLSMTDWKFTGEAPPRSVEEWEAEFGKYKASPEYKRVNRGMSLEDFKFIYWMEWAHRMWGRTLGLAFVLPALAFASKGWVKGALARRLGLLGAAGACQGLVGWWMVRSGLEEPENPWDTPRVSPVRLAAHLTSAFAIFLGLLYTTLQLTFPGPPPALAAGAGPAALTAVSSLRRAAHPLAGLIALTALSGAFVAGLDAGRAFNTWPTMGGAGRLVPLEYWEEGGLKGATSGTAPAQFHHRTLAYCTLASTSGVWLAYRKTPGLPLACRRALGALPLLAAAQATLGVLTLLSHVPPTLGTMHQVGALTLLSGATGLIFLVRRGPTGLVGVVKRAL